MKLPFHSENVEEEEEYLFHLYIEAPPSIQSM